MNTVIEFFESAWFQILGYTLLHSLWQALFITAGVTILFRVIPAKSSNVRYIIASSGLLLIAFSSICTFLYLVNSPADVTLLKTPGIPYYNAGQLNGESGYSLSPYLTLSKYYIQTFIPFFVLLWLCGTVLFSLRMLTGFAYVEKLRSHATLLENDWSRYVHLLARQLHVRRLVLLAESAAIQAPVVVGYFKPMILVPIGLCTSLTTAQLETIFLHEMMHIKRKDYLINLMQIFVEAIYFFNPFVWFISGMIKQEREHCCDDAVVSLHGGAMEYVSALATLEEHRLSKTGLSISLAENKHQLLIRIKRIMEKSVKNYSGRERILPALLLVVGLVCASWISNKNNTNPMAASTGNKSTVMADTIKKDNKIKKNRKLKENEASATDDQTRATREQDDSNSNAGITKESNSDTEAEHLPFPGLPPSSPPFPQAVAPLRHMDVPMMAWRDESEWKEFSKEFEENFKIKFGDFYEKHGEDIRQMIAEIQSKLDTRFDSDWEMKMQDVVQKQAERAALQANEWKKNAQAFSERNDELRIKSEADIKRWEERRLLHEREFEKNQAEFEKNMKAFEANNKQFEEELKKELRKDGYLGADENLVNMHWHNGQIEINGKKIRPEDEKKYNDLQAKFFLGAPHPPRP